MKKIGVMVVMAVAIISLLVCTGNAAAKKAYTLGISSGGGNGLDAQLSTCISDIAKAFSLSNDEQIKVVNYNDEKKLIDAAEKNELDFIYPISFDLADRFMQQKKYTPFIAPVFFGTKQQNYCIYVKKDNTAKGINDLRDDRVTITGTAFNYYLLKVILGENPENIFSKIKTSPNGMSSIYSLAMDDSEAAMASDTTIVLLKYTNPGPIKNIRKLPSLCQSFNYIMPLLRSKRVPMIFADKFNKYFGGIPKNDALKNYRPLFNMYKLSFVPVTEKDYEPILKLYREAHKNGWDKDYERWIKYAKDTGK
jgi:ABC-type phosphate/phosphonate transport system substrate-binding protein